MTDIKNLAQEIAKMVMAVDDTAYLMTSDESERAYWEALVEPIITRHLAAPLKERDERVRLRAIRDCMDVVSGADFSTATGYAHARRTLLTGLRRLEARSNIALRELGEGGRR